MPYLMLDENGLDADEFARLVFEAIDRSEYWIVPQPQMLDPLLEARNKIIASLYRKGYELELILECLSSSNLND